jgi:predicted alpha/beta-fold hydrolase
VKIPLFVIHAEDDPVVPFEALPLEDLKQNPHCFTAITKTGGHTGWLVGLYPSGLSYADQLCLEFIETLVHKGLPTTAEIQSNRSNMNLTTK